MQSHHMYAHLHIIPVRMVTKMLFEEFSAFLLAGALPDNRLLSRERHTPPKKTSSHKEEDKMHKTKGKGLPDRSDLGENGCGGPCALILFRNKKFPSDTMSGLTLAGYYHVVQMLKSPFWVIRALMQLPGGICGIRALK